MATDGGESDLQAMLGLVHAGLDDLPPVGFPLEVLRRLSELVPCDLLSAAPLDIADPQPPWFQDLTGECDVEGDGSSYRLFRQHYWACEPCCYPDRTGDTTSVTKISDFYGELEYHRTGMYAEYLGVDDPVEREIMVVLPAGHRRTVRICLFRGPGPDFTERDRSVLTLLRPHLGEVLRRADAARSGTPALTPRQHELLALVATGRTNAQVARQLGLSEATVRKHLENVYGRLGVTNRVAALAAVLPDQRRA